MILMIVEDDILSSLIPWAVESGDDKMFHCSIKKFRFVAHMECPTRSLFRRLLVGFGSG